MKRFILYFILFIVLFLGLQRLVVPKYQEELVEGAMTREYYEDDKNHQILFLGDCEVYSNYSPITLFNEFGYTSYIRGNSQQLMSSSYHLLRETLRYETPNIVILSVNALRYGEEYEKESYHRLLLDGMKNSSIKETIVEGETFLSYLFPSFRYHSRIFQLTSEDFKYYFQKKQITHNGYLMRVDTLPVTTIYRGTPLSNYEFPKENMEYLEKIRKLCQENDIELILIKTPSTYPYWYEEYDNQVKEYAYSNHLTYLNLYDKVEEMEIDYQLDTYDAGLHFNIKGAEKLTRYLGSYIQDHYLLEDMRRDEKTAKKYEEKTKYYEEMKEEQYLELEKYGKITMYGGKE